jgi:hypothetical protein
MFSASIEVFPMFATLPAGVDAPVELLDLIGQRRIFFAYKDQEVLLL